MRKLLYLVPLIVLWFACGTRQEPKTIYLVRHAEKMLVGEDPELSIAGNARSRKLGQILAEKEIEHVFSTNTIRTKATVQPLADQKGLDIEIYDVKKHDGLVRELRKRKGNAVVVGHSNTIHHVANYFIGGEEPYRELEDIEYDFIFVVTLDADGNSSVQRKLYKEF